MCRRIISLLMSISLMLFTLSFNCTSAFAAETPTFETSTFDFFEYEISDDFVTITDTNYKVIETIPSEIDNLPVKKLGERAFYACLSRNEMKSVYIPTNVEVIEDECFLAVLGGGYKTYFLPDTIKSIGDYAIGYICYETYHDDWVDDNIRKLEDVTIYGYAGTVAETYANENGFTFIALESQTTTTPPMTATTTAIESQTQTTAATVPTSTLLGDINLDGSIDLCDAVLLQKYTAETVDLNQQQQLNGDCNADGSTDAQDALSLLRFLVRITNVLPDVPII